MTSPSNSSMVNNSSRLDFESLVSREYSPTDAMKLPPRNEKKRSRPSIRKLKHPISERDKSMSKLVLQLVSHTPSYSQHIPEEARRPASEVLTPLPFLRPPPRVDPKFHQVHVGDWISKINYDGFETSKEPKKPMDIKALLNRPRNPFLDSDLQLEDKIVWSGDPEELRKQAERVPLILELGVAGQSIARHVYPRTVLQRPTPAVQSDAYRQRVEKDTAAPVVSSSTSKLRADREKRSTEIVARQKRRAQMAKDKTNRVTEAMGTLNMLGKGKGRTITSSLMGPGGTERTGRPTKDSHTSHDAIYVEQLELVRQHDIVRDLGPVGLRQMNRPKLPNSVVRPDLPWQLQVKVEKDTKTNSNGRNVSYDAMMLGASPGSLSKTKLLAEADLTPTEGKLVLVEYLEENPPIQLSKGMASNIINYYRGDKAKCPVSAGGGDRPARRKRAVEMESSTSARGNSRRLLTHEDTTIMDWVGELPKKKQTRNEKESVDVLPEGVSEILHPRMQGPFLGEVAEGKVVTGLVNNLFVAPMVRHEPQRTDFLMILTPGSGASRAGQRDSMGVVLRDFPKNVFTVGQTTPRTRVFAPGSQGEKSFTGPYISYHCARALARTRLRTDHGLKFDELQDRVLPNHGINGNVLRARLKVVAVCDKGNNSTWVSQELGRDGYYGLEALGNSISPEGIVANETARAGELRLSDMGITQLIEKGSQSVTALNIAILYLTCQLKAAQARHEKAMIGLQSLKIAHQKGGKNAPTKSTIALCERATNQLQEKCKALEQKQDIAEFILEQLQLTSWHLTGEFLDVHRKGEGSGMMSLTGNGDPTGTGEGFCFLREADTKPSKSIGEAGLEARVKKITGTSNDLRKLTMKEMGSILRSYGMAEKYIATLKRWDRVHVIRDYSTKASSDGIGDGMERFARGEKMKLSEQKEMYRERIQVIWNRHLDLLSSEPAIENEGGGADGTKGKVPDIDDDDESEDDDFMAEIQQEMTDTKETNLLVAEYKSINDETPQNRGQLHEAVRDTSIASDARELAAWHRQREEERIATEGMTATGGQSQTDVGLNSGRQVIRRRVVKTFPDGKQEISFKFIVNPTEVGNIKARLSLESENRAPKFGEREIKFKYGGDEKPPGHSFFEDDDDFEYSAEGRMQAPRRGNKRKRSSTPRNRNLQFGKLKNKMTQEERMRKRQREDDELETYALTHKRKGTSNRRERGSIRERRPHVIYAEKLESIRSAVEKMVEAGPFLKPVDERVLPRYYTVISHPIDLSKIRDKIAK